MRIRYFYFFSSLSLLFLSSCCPRTSSYYSLLSDNPQMALVVDLYNSLHPERTPLVFHHVKEIQVTNLANDKFDIIVGKNLSRFSAYFKDIRFLKPFLPNDYQEILSRYQYSFDAQRMLPLAFDLPVVLSNTKDDLPLFLPISYLISLKELSFKKEEPFLAFSPFSNPFFLWYWSILEGVDWQTSVLGDLSWNKDRLNSFLLNTRVWTEKNFYKAQQKFLEKYNYLGELNLLKKAYIKASFSTLSQWRNYSMENERVTYSYLTDGEHLTALQEDTTYLALSLFANNSRDSKDFMRWLTSFEGQSQIVKTLKRKLPYSYGFLNSFSFLQEVNIRTISEEYPELAGRLPDLQNLKLSKPLPYSLPVFLKKAWFTWLEACIQQDKELPLENFLKEGLLFVF